MGFWFFLIITFVIIFVCIAYVIINYGLWTKYDYINEKIEEYTGIRRSSIPAQLERTLEGVTFNRFNESKLYYLYEYRVDATGEEKLFLMMVENNDQVYDNETRIFRPVYEDGKRKVYSSEIGERENKKYKIISTSGNTPSAFVGTRDGDRTVYRQ